jgi:hypothetical protein
MAHYDKQNSPLLVSNEMLLGCSEAANELGIDLNTILKEHGMESGLLSAPKVFLNHHQVIGFLQAVAEHFDCQHFGLLVGKHQPPLSGCHPTSGLHWKKACCTRVFTASWLVIA